MDDLGKILAQTVLERISEIETESNLDYLINFAQAEIREEAQVIKDKMASIKAILAGI